MVEIMAAYPAGVIGTTKENLKAAADGELMEWGTLYPDVAGTAKDEGFAPIRKPLPAGWGGREVPLEE